MAGTASVLMRAFRIADSSYHTWRAGAYDPTMSDAVGDQAPPFPPGDYSDHVVVGFLEGPLARDDAEAAPVPGMGTSGAPVPFPNGAPPLVNSNPGLDCRDYRSVTVYVYITTPGTASLATVFAAWAGLDAADFSLDAAIQRSDDAISGGVSPQNLYQAEFTMPPPVGVGPILGPFNLPVRGRRFFVSVSMDTADVEGYVLMQRLA